MILYDDRDGDLKIVRLGPEDWESYKALHPIKVEAVDADHFKEDLTCRDDWHIAAFQGTEPAGMFSVFSTKDGWAMLDQLNVLPAYRNQGLSKLLYGSALNIATNHMGCSHAFVDVDIKNQAGLRAALSAGFREAAGDQQTPSQHYTRLLRSLDDIGNAPP